MRTYKYRGKKDIKLMYLLVNTGLVNTARIAMQRIADGAVFIEGEPVKPTVMAHGPIIKMSRTGPFVLNIEGEEPVRVIPNPKDKVYLDPGLIFLTPERKWIGTTVVVSTVDVPDESTIKFVGCTHEVLMEVIEKVREVDTADGVTEYTYSVEIYEETEIE